MTYSELSQSERDTLDIFMGPAREQAGRAAQFLQSLAPLKDFYLSNGVAAILAKLGDDDIIPNKTNIADAVDVTRGDADEAITGMVYFLAADTAADRQRRVKFAGIRASQ